jgi:hypothetical protein
MQPTHWGHGTAVQFFLMYPDARQHVSTWSQPNCMSNHVGLLLLSGLVAGMLGMAVGDERTVTVTLPQTWEPAQLRGVRADCTIKVKEIFEWELPEVRHVPRGP